MCNELKEQENEIFFLKNLIIPKKRKMNIE